MNEKKLDAVIAASEGINAICDQMNAAIRYVNERLASAGTGLTAEADSVVSVIDNDMSASLHLTYGKFIDKWCVHVIRRDLMTVAGDDEDYRDTEPDEVQIAFSCCSREHRLLLIASLPQLLDRLLVATTQITQQANQNLAYVMASLPAEAANSAKEYTRG